MRANGKKMSFNAGEVSPYLRGRLDLEKLHSGSKEVTNFFVLPQGPLTRRAGTVYQTKMPDKPGDPIAPPPAPDLLTDTHMGPYREEEGEENNFDYLWTLRETDPAQEPDSYKFVYGNGVFPDVSAEIYITEEEDPSQVSISFDATGAPSIGFVEDDQLILRKKVDSVLTTYGPFTGISLQLWYDGILKDHISDAATRQLELFYIKEGENKVYRRDQLENFAVENEAVTGLGYIPKILIAEHVIGFDLYLKAIDTNDILRFIHIKRYQPFGYSLETVGFTGGFVGETEYQQVVIEVPDSTQLVGFEGGFETGEYRPTVLLQEEQQTFGFEGTFQTGAYVQVVVSESAADTFGFTAGFLTGSYVEVIKLASGLDTFGFDGGFQSGAYELP